MKPHIALDHTTVCEVAKKLPAPAFLGSLLFLVLFISCNNSGPDKGAAYQPVFSSGNTEKKILLLGFPSFSYSETAEPLIRYLNAHLPGIHVKMKACVSFAEYLTYLDEQKFDLTLVNGIQALDAIHKGYSIIGKVADDDKYSGVIFALKNAGINKITDLNGKKVALVPSKTIPGTMMPLYYLHQNGLDVNHDIIQVKVSSFESAIIATYIGKSEAGLCLKRSWGVYVKNHPEILNKVAVKWESEPLINNALLIKQTINDTLRTRLIDLFFSMQNSGEGREVLKRLDFSGFQKADNETYQPMMDFKKRYDAVIH